MFIINPYIYGGGYLLNNYPASNGWSVRLIDNSYSGALVRIRRSSDSAEKDFYPDSNDELSMSSEDGAGTSLTTWISTDSGYIVTWYNQVTGAADLTQSTGANQPRIVNAGTLETKGGKAAIYFDGSNDYLDRGVMTGIYSYPFSFSAVGSNESSAANAWFFSQRLTGGDQSGFTFNLDRRTNKVGFFMDQGSSNYPFTYTAQDNTANQRLQTFIIDSSGNGELWKDGASQSTQSSISSWATSPNNNFEVGRQDAGSPSYMTGYAQEIVLWNTVDQTSNRTAIETNINDFYSIY